MGSDLFEQLKSESLDIEPTVCARCGFCTFVCPAYNDTLWDSQSPRGKLYQLKELIQKGKPIPTWETVMDFMHDELADGGKFRVLTVIDVFTRECLALHVGRSLRGADVATVLDGLVAHRGKPRSIQCDQGTEFTSLAMDHWGYWNKVGLDFSRRGQPGDNARNEAFNSLVRRECLTHHYFLGLEEASEVLESWKEDYNNERPHGSLGQIPPTEYRSAWTESEGLARLPEMT